MEKVRIALMATVAAVTLSSVAYAADDDAATNDRLTESNGWYMSGSAGLTFLQNSENRGGNTSFDLSSDPGFAITGALGKELGNGFRAEGELGYREYGLDHATVYSPGGLGISTGSASGTADAFSMMGNGYYDFTTGGPIRPYIGAGIGFARVALSEAAVGGNAAVNDSDVDFAYQAMAGVEYSVTPRGTLYTGYRYFATLDPRFDDAAGQRIDSQFASNDIEVGYRLGF